MRTSLFCAVLLCGSLAGTAPAAAQSRGFQLNRFEPTPAGEWSFFVDHPWYSSQRYFAAGLTFNYGHNPLIIGMASSDGAFTAQGALIAHQLIGHVDLAGSVLDRLLFSVSLPVTLLERGDDATAGRFGVALVSTAAVGDPRLGVMFRMYGDPYRDAFSLNLGAYLWAPINGSYTFPEQTGDQGVRFMPKIVLGGLSHRVLWSFTGGFYYRPRAALGALPQGLGNSVGPELQLGFALAYADTKRRFSIGPEILVHTDALDGNAFRVQHTNLEALLGIHTNIARVFQISAAGGVGVLRGAGTPDARALLRLAYAPIRKEVPKDRDKDGVPDAEDACPGKPGLRTGNPDTNGCPVLPDGDQDGVFDAQDLCPEEPAGKSPDPERPGCPLADRDGDGITDNNDQCVSEPAGLRPDMTKPGCPVRDSDADGVFDDEDQCPAIPAGPNKSATRKGCPDTDRDADGIFDGEDQCPTEPIGLSPDPQRRGCPLPDRDRDQAPDAVDACPDQPGALSPDPKQNGCPGLVEVKADQIVIKEQVFFATNKATVLKKSFALLDAVAYTMKTLPSIKKVRVEGHTDNKGKAERNTALSEQRASSVMQYLIDKGVASERLQAKGFGPTQPIADNKSGAGRAANRRVDFRILEPPQAGAATTPSAQGQPAPAPTVNPAPQPAPDADAGSSKSSKKRRHRKR